MPDSRAVLVFLAAATTACGAVSASSAVGDAEQAIARARAQESDRFAPYEMALAELYLDKAREEQDHAHYGDARDLAREAQRSAEEAGRKASSRGTPEAPGNPANIQREAPQPADAKP